MPCVSRLRTCQLVGVLLIATACSTPTDLDPSESCIAESGDSRPAFEDPAPEAAVEYPSVSSLRA